MQIVLFSSPFNFDEEIGLVISFLLEPEIIFHLRKPDLSKDELRLYLNKLPQENHHKIVLHQYIELLSEFNLRGFHCTRHFIQNTKISLIELKEQFPNSTFSRSCHNLLELKEIDDYSYIFLSPVFDSISKKGYSSSFNFNEVNEVLEKTSIPVYALGGVSKETISQVKDSRFKGVGILGSVWNSKTPLESYKEIKKRLLFN